MSIAVLLIILVVLAAGGILGTIGAVRTDGYGPRPDRGDRGAEQRPLL